MKKKNILITGGAGFIGSHLAEKLATIGHSITIADNLSRGLLTNITTIKNRVRFLNIDLRTEQGAQAATKNQDVVFNLAALNTGVDFDIGRTEKMFEENMLLQMMPIRAAAINRVKVFIQISTASVYSINAMVKRLPIKENDDKEEPEDSKLGYALAKRIGERLAIWYSTNSPMKTVVTRFINVYGTRDHFDDLGHFIPMVIRKCYEAHSTIEVFGSGNQKRSFLHVDDAVSALLLLSQKGQDGEVYNIDPQDEHSVKEIVSAVRHIMNKDRVTIQYNTDKPEGSKRRILDNAKIKKLGWNPNHNLIESLPEIVDDVVSRISHGYP